MSAAASDEERTAWARADLWAMDDRARVLDAAHRCVDVLVRTAIIDDAGAPTWPAWELGPRPPVRGRRGPALPL